MEKNPRTCIRNCFRIDLCENCEFFKSVQQGNAEIKIAREMFNKLKLNVV